MKMPEDKEPEKNVVISEFLQSYLAGGYGRMKPAHVELFLFSQLKRYGFFDTNGLFDEHKAATKLKTDLSTIRRVRAKCDMLFDSGAKRDLKNELRSLIRQKGLSVRGDMIRLRVTDITLRSEIEEYLAIHGTLVDYSFNRHLLTMSLVQFMVFLEKVYDKDVTTDFLKIVERDSKLLGVVDDGKQPTTVTLSKIATTMSKTVEFAANIANVIEKLQVFG